MMLLVLTIWVILFPETKVVYRLFKSLPQMPDFLENAKKRKSGTNLVGAREHISKVVGIKSSSRRVDRIDVLK